MKNLWYLQKTCRRKRESNDQLCLALAHYSLMNNITEQLLQSDGAALYWQLHKFDMLESPD